ncbi:hypothetical protein Q5M85_00260 [Paraclostridium bifermentans]|nr:hypothetical protein [Paraclostridium bifermentans]
MPEVAITTDVIVGFPGETNDEFNQTYKFLSDIKLSQMHVFKYSQKRNTSSNYGKSNGSSNETTKK